MNTSTLQASAETDDIALARSACQDPEAFAMLYERHLPQVYRYHLVRTGSVAEAQDLTSQTFIAALEGIRGFRGTGSFAAWLMGIARNKCAQFFRQRKPEIPLETAADLPDMSTPTEQAAGQRLQIGLIQRALRNLIPERAEAIVLCLFCGLTAAEAARALGKSEAAVKMLVYRGLRDLRADLTPIQEEVI